LERANKLAPCREDAVLRQYPPGERIKNTHHRNPIRDCTRWISRRTFGALPARLGASRRARGGLDRVSGCGMLAAALGPCKVRLGPESALTGSGPFSFYVLFRKFVVSIIWAIKKPGLV